MKQLASSASSVPTTPAATSAAVRIVGVGASAGGLEAFSELLRHIPADAGVAYVLVQHLDPTHRSLLTELLARVTKIPVAEITDNTAPEANRVYVIPPNSDLTIKGGVLKLRPRSRSGGPARSIDTFLQSLASDVEERAIGVILSGAGSDGAEGLRAIKNAGGVTFAQDPESAKYDSMPRAAAATECVDFVLPPEKIAAEISRLVRTPGGTKRRAAKNARTRSGALARPPRSLPGEANSGRPPRGPINWPGAPDNPDLRKLYLLLRSRTGVDFSFYRMNTIRRRLSRRLTVTKVKDLERYVRHVRENPQELDALYQDLLINVTSFFRNPAVFEALKRKVFPKLVKTVAGSDALRFWVAGCSTGQEPYSLAMAYAEFAEAKSVRVPLQIFATDVNGAVLEIARAGRYSANQLEGVSSSRLQRFFDKEAEGYRVNKTIRDLVVFAQQDLVTDPPFTRVDLISCRNMLIYLEPALQQKIIPAFHYSLRADGYLLLGSSESTGQFTHLFETVEAKHKVYKRKPGASWLRYERPPSLPAATVVKGRAVQMPPKPPPIDPPKEADRLLLSRYAPVSVLINAEGEIVQFRGDTRRYLDLPAGKATFQLVKMARQGLALALQRALLRAKKDDRPTTEKDVRFDSRRGAVTIDVIPLKNIKPRYFLVVFQKAPSRPPAESAARKNGNGNGHSPADAKQVAELRHELSETREHVQSLQEEYDTSVEELQASNEEVQSANEELQSLNEELETSNEELESSNEELTTLNEELATRNAELRESERRLREQAEMLDLAPVHARSLKDRVIFWNAGCEKLYGFTKEDAIGQNSHMLLSAQYPEALSDLQAKVLKQGEWSGEVSHRRKDGTLLWVKSHWVLHRDEAGRPRAILEVCSDITARREAEQALAHSEQFNRTILQSSPDGIKVLDADGRLVFLTKRGQELMELPHPRMAEGAYWPSLWEGEARVAAEQAYRQALDGQTARFQGFRVTPKGTPKWWDVLVQPIPGANGQPRQLLAVSRDITDYKQQEAARTQETRLLALRADIALALARGSEPREVFATVANSAVERLGAAVARIWMVDPSTELLVLQASAGPESPRAGRHDQLKIGDLRIGRIAEERKPLLTNEASSDPEIGDTDWAQREGIVGFAGYPLVVEDRAVGVIAIYTRYRMDPRVLDELGLSADALAQYIVRKTTERDRLQLQKQSFEARREVDILNEIGRKIAAEFDHEKLTQAVVDAATNLCKAEIGVFSHRSSDAKGERRCFHTLSAALREGGNARLPRDFESLIAAIADHETLRSSDVTTEPDFQAALPDRGPAGETPAVRSFLAVPVISRTGERLGGLCFCHSQPGVFTDRDERLVTGVAAQAGVAFDNAHLFGQLEQKVSERTARLKETISELQAFSYTVSHDLRAPLRAMQSYAQVLQEECSAQLDAQGREYLHRIEQAGMRLDRLIQDVLTYGRISRTELNLRPLDLKRLILDIIQQYPALQAPKATIDIEGELPVVLAEESSATQCFSNLLGNAVKFVPAGVSPHVRIRAENRGDAIRIWVEDNGIGIAPDHHERIFKMFERVDHANRYDGTGIGLAIVRKAMERMGGRVGLESTVGQGSRFWLEFRRLT